MPETVCDSSNTHLQVTQSKWPAYLIIWCCFYQLIQRFTSSNSHWTEETHSDRRLMNRWSRMNQTVQKNQFRKESYFPVSLRLWITGNNVINYAQTSIYHQEPRVFILCPLYMLFILSKWRHHWLESCLLFYWEITLIFIVSQYKQSDWISLSISAIHCATVRRPKDCVWISDRFGCYSNEKLN